MGGDRSHMSEVVIRHTYGLKVVHADVHVQTSLNVVLRDAALLELLGCLAHRK